jgi:hypothetical protein
VSRLKSVLRAKPYNAAPTAGSSATPPQAHAFRGARICGPLCLWCLGRRVFVTVDSLLADQLLRDDDGFVPLARLEPSGKAAGRPPARERDVFSLDLGVRGNAGSEFPGLQGDADLEIRLVHDDFFLLRDPDDARLLELVEAVRLLLERVEPRLEPRLVWRVRFCVPSLPSCAPVAPAAAPPAACSSPCVASAPC